MQRGKKFLWQYLPVYVGVLIVSLAVVSWFASTSVTRLYMDRTASDLEARSHLLGRLLKNDILELNRDIVQFQCQELGQRLATRFTVILPSGEVIGDSDEDPGNMDNHANRPEIQIAYSGEIGQSIRYSRTVKKEMMYVAVPVAMESELLAVARSSLPVTGLSQTLNSIYRRMGMAGLIVALAAVLTSMAISRRLKKPVELLTEGATHFGRGDLEYRLHISDPDEFRLLGDAMNQMAVQLNDRIHTITSQRNELESVMSSMIEAVLVVDPDERIVRINHAASQLFGFAQSDAVGRNVQEIIRNIQLLEFIRETLSSKKTGDREIVIHQEEDRFLQAHGTILLDYEKKVNGMLVVLHDITRLKRLENLRKDFAANVSHELKTPITAITGSVETLIGGAMSKPDDAKRFLNIIQKHADRLNAIIEDLLNLSRLEEESEKQQITFEEVDLFNALHSAVSACQAKAERSKIKIETDCQSKITAHVNQILLEEAVINLVDNAIAYSEPDSIVTVRCSIDEAYVKIDVIDEGCGIPREHHERLFERFYRVDPARSRGQGGTGLGLAIVKHIMQVHDGQVAVKSIPGEGSTFTLLFPINQ